MKNKFINVVLKKIQSYSFIIFLALIVAAFIVIAQLNSRNGDHKPVDNNPKTTEPKNQNNDVNEEVFELPINVSSPLIARNYYPVNGTLEEKAAAIIKVSNNRSDMSKGVSYSIDKETPFDVLASLSGTVTKAESSALHGFVVEIEHLNGIKTHYSSLESINVEVGDKVKQGDVIGVAGTNSYDQESGVHVHFEIFKYGQNLNPNELIGTKISDQVD